MFETRSVPGNMLMDSFNYTVRPDIMDCRRTFITACHKRFKLAVISQKYLAFGFVLFEDPFWKRAKRRKNNGWKTNTHRSRWKKRKRGFGTIRYEQCVVWVRIEHGTSWTRVQKFANKIVRFLISFAEHDACNTVHGERLKVVETESAQLTLYLKINLPNRWVGSG